MATDGEWIDPLCLSDRDITLERIATGLANRCRYHGWPREYYSVAEHCVHLARSAIAAVQKTLARVLLLHDAAEAFFWDIPSPFKADPRWSELIGALLWQIDKLQHRILRMYVGPDYVRHAEECHTLDDAIRIIELRRLFATSEPFPWPGKGPAPELKLWSPAEGREQWLKTARDLGLQHVVFNVVGD